MDLHVGTTDIFIAKSKDFTDTKTRTVHQNDHDSGLQIIDGIDERSNFITCRNKGDKLIEPSEGELIRIPGLMQNIESEETKLGDDRVDGAIRKTAIPLDPLDEVSFLLPGDLGRTTIQMLGNIVEINGDVG